LVARIVISLKIEIFQRVARPIRAVEVRDDTVRAPRSDEAICFISALLPAANPPDIFSQLGRH
jgi:hypothetical protein